MNAPRLRHRPIYGGVFGMGRYALASLPCVSRGLHAVQYMVIEPRDGAVLSIAEGKLEALAEARRMIGAVAMPPVDESAWRQAGLWPEDEFVGNGDPPPLASRPISRRRREVFERSHGRCHYCRETLTLDGKWHIEHMIPRALGGADESTNLVAACVPCNLSKSDRTALEFVTQRGAGTPIENETRNQLAISLIR